MTIYALITFFMMGFAPPLFPLYWGVLLLFASSAEALGLICAVLTRNSKTGVSALTVLIVAMLVLSGFLVRHVPVYLAWVRRASPIAYAMDALVQADMGFGATFQMSSGLKIWAVNFIPASLRTGMSIDGDVLVMFGMAVGLRVIAYGSLEAAALLNIL